MGVCKKDKKFCDGEDLVCRLNPSDLHPFFYKENDGSKIKFINRYCSNYVKDVI